ncbi:PREDICTED: uncharacterized protein LOC109123679, partial [Olea europaea subsp. europaea]
FLLPKLVGSLSCVFIPFIARAKTSQEAWSSLILGAPLDDEDLTEKILDNFGENYKEIVRTVQARDSPIGFDELHVKLLSFEASLPTLAGNLQTMVTKTQ